MKIYLRPIQHQIVVEMGYPVLPTYSDGNRRKIFYIKNTEENREKILSCLKVSNPYLPLIVMNKNMRQEMEILREVVALAKEDNLERFSINGYQLMVLNACQIYLDFEHPSIKDQNLLLEGVIPEKDLDELGDKLLNLSRSLSNLATACIKSKLNNDKILAKDED